MTMQLRPAALALLAAALPSPRAAAQLPQPAEAATQEVWESVYFGDSKVGSAKYTFRPAPLEDGTPATDGRKELRLSLRRGPQQVNIRVESGTVEASDGRVVGVSMRQSIGQNQILAMDGKLQPDGRMRITVTGGASKDDLIPWPEQVVGTRGERRILAERRPRAGESFRYTVFEPTVARAVAIEVKAVGTEKVTLPLLGERELFRVEATPEKLDGFQLPKLVVWADPETYELVASRGETPGLGEMTMVRSSREAALAPGVGEVPDIWSQSIPLGHFVPDIHAQQAVVYTLKTTTDEDPKTLLPQDPGQKVEPQPDGSLRVTVVARRKPPEGGAEVPPADPEYTESNLFINSADEGVQALAREAVAGATDPWEKARRVERWVSRSMRSSGATEAMATADHVAKTLTGDCTEHAMLAAAMCRAAGVPSRTALGLVYVAAPDRPKLAYHMWTEVYVNGEWLAIDATLGMGSVGPGHLKVAAHSWKDVKSLTPLLPVMRVLMARPEADVAGYTPAGR